PAPLLHSPASTSYVRSTMEVTKALRRTGRRRGRRLEDVAHETSARSDDVPRPAPVRCPMAMKSLLSFVFVIGRVLPGQRGEVSPSLPRSGGSTKWRRWQGERRC